MRVWPYFVKATDLEPWGLWLTQKKGMAGTAATSVAMLWNIFKDLSHSMCSWNFNAYQTLSIGGKGSLLKGPRTFYYDSGI